MSAGGERPSRAKEFVVQLYEGDSWVALLLEGGGCSSGSFKSDHSGGVFDEELGGGIINRRLR